MDIVDDMGEIWKFWLHILILLKKWVQKMYRGLPVRPLSSDPFLGLEHRNSCSKGYRLDMKIPYLDPWSTLKTGPDDTQIISFGGGHLTLSSATWTALAVSQAIGQLWGSRLDILTLLKKWVQVQIEPSKLGKVTQPCPTLILDMAVWGPTVRISNFPLQIWILLEKWVQTQAEPSQLKNISRPSPHAHIPFLSIADATGQIGSWDLDILNPLKKWV